VARHDGDRWNGAPACRAGMNRPERTEEPVPATEYERHEAVGYLRCEVDQAERTLATLRARKQELLRQITLADAEQCDAERALQANRAELQRQLDVVAAENRALERELLERLATWRKLDEASVRVEEIVPQLRAVTGSFTYRFVAGLLHVVNRGLGVLRGRKG
jgi:SMC interacting uncharacterized protein involved in chromosome segregation